MAMLLKVIYSLNAVNIKTPITFLPDIERAILNIIQKNKTLYNKKLPDGISNPDFKLYYKPLLAYKAAMLVNRIEPKAHM